MTLNREIKAFDKSCVHLEGRIDHISQIEPSGEDEEFMAEAIAFRLFRIQERLIRAFFLECCVKTQSLSKKRIHSKLRCKDWETAEEILKSGNRFLDWGNPTSTRNMASLIFKNGYPVNDLLLVKQSTITDLQKIRNFIAHDSNEAHSGFIKTSKNYLRTGDPTPLSAGALLLYRKRPVDKITLKVIFEKVSDISSMIKAI
ncbi:hypothetical protein K3722_05275 [Leisingera caerulea]|uniref:RiboL-PSP-HEPN domain-containing protein n=1 Tax=Leisingera caerulea TaxID=506591 RepID=A0ABY5WYX4_LEICA|nr:hypothetical protein K3722_05275 [Leisingera caerulea]